jgi:ABC-2 type transport system ATP-binding protein
MTEPVIAVDALEKSYGSVRAVDAISFEVAAGEIFGVVGPNGAGKTTTIECLEGLRAPDGGRVSVLGLDPRRDGDALRERIGAQLQQSALPARMRVEEAMRLFASFYKRPLEPEAILEGLGLADRKRVAYADLSGGQKQRLSIALALVGDPQLVFLDELTSGLDPQARHATWDLVRDARAKGKTVFLTTHYMEEADQLCNRLAIVDHGRMLALGTPAELKESTGMGTVVVVSVAGDPAPIADLLVAEVDGATEATVVDGKIILGVKGTEGVLPAVVQVAVEHGHVVTDLSVTEPTLETVFIKMTGKDLRE